MVEGKLMMNIISKEHLITGRKNEKTQEKIRIKLRILLNKYRKGCIFYSNYSDSKLAFHLENEGFKKAYIVYKSTAIANCDHYSKAFNDLYFNEVDHQFDKESMIETKEKASSSRLVLALRKLKKGY